MAMHKQDCCICHKSFEARRSDAITCSPACRKAMSRLLLKCDRTLPKEKYQLLYVDPPWHFKTHSRKGQGKSPSQHYKTLGVEAIKRLPFGTLAADDAWLFMWVYGPLEEHMPEIARSWGFNVSSQSGFIWVKTVKDNSRPRMGTGYNTRKCAETMLIGRRGRPELASHSVLQVQDLEGFSEVIYHPRAGLQHSEKPAEFRDRIVELVGDVKRIELFCRHNPEGWDAWGNEVGLLENQNQLIAA